MAEKTPVSENAQKVEQPPKTESKEESSKRMKNIQGLFGKKIGMTQVFAKNGDRLPITVIQLDPVEILQKKTTEKDGYNAIKVGFNELNKSKAKKINKAKQGQMKGSKSYRYLKELQVNSIDEVKVGQIFDINAFEEGNVVDVIGTSKGKGFAGVMKRHNFAGGPKSHGSHFQRAPGSIGASAYPARVFKNRKMPGHYGFARVTVQNLKIIQIIAQDNLMLIKGAIPGPNNSLVEIRHSVKQK